MGDSFSLITAFSRDGPKKVYVQHRLQEYAKEVNELISKQGAYFYVCGDASHMAREVNSTLGRIIASEREISETQGDEAVKTLRAKGVYQVSQPLNVIGCVLICFCRRMYGHKNFLFIRLVRSLVRVIGAAYFMTLFSLQRAQVSIKAGFPL